MKSLVLLLVGLLALANINSFANAAFLKVYPAGTTTTATFTDLQTALNTAAAGDTIQVYGGTYKPSTGDACGLIMPATATDITIKGELNNAVYPTYDCEETNRWMTIDGGTYNTVGGIKIENINIVNTKTAAPISPLRGAGIGFNMAGTSANPNYLTNVNIQDSTLIGSGWGDTGGCVDFRSSFVNVQNSTFVNCKNQGGKLSGALYVFGRAANPGYVHFTDSVIDRASGSVGGGVLTEGDQNALFERTTFSNNFASCCGGAIDDGGSSNTTFKE